MISYIVFAGLRSLDSKLLLFRHCSYLSLHYTPSDSIISAYLFLQLSSVVFFTILSYLYQDTFSFRPFLTYKYLLWQFSSFLLLQEVFFYCPFILVVFRYWTSFTNLFMIISIIYTKTTFVFLFHNFSIFIDNNLKKC